MAEAFKHLINTQVMHDVADHLQRVWPAFPRSHFLALALQGLDALEFKARADLLATALQHTLPERFEHAADIVQGSLKALQPPARTDDPDDHTGGQQTDATGLAGWALWGLGTWVARQGLAHPERALACLHALTQRFTAEFAIRPFIQHHPEHVLATLKTWVHDPSAHVRRLVSEGTRPRLPWGLRLHALVQDPRPCLPLLEALQDDPTGYVRRSVANHLNDIAKDHPQIVVDWLQRHRPEASVARERLLKHASRSLIKQGDPATLAAWGLTSGFQGEVVWRVTPSDVRVGDRVTLHAQLQSTSPQTQAVALDYVVHHPRPSGKMSVKVFKGSAFDMAAHGTTPWSRHHALRPTSTRAIHPGMHVIELQLNGQRLARAEVLVRP